MSDLCNASSPRRKTFVNVLLQLMPSLGIFLLENCGHESNKKICTYTKGVIGGYFCPFIFPSKNKHHNRKCTLGYFFKVPVKSRTNRQRETIQLKPNKRRQIRGLGRGERWQNSAGLLLRAKLLF